MVLSHSTNISFVNFNKILVGRPITTTTQSPLQALLALRGSQGTSGSGQSLSGLSLGSGRNSGGRQVNVGLSSVGLSPGGSGRNSGGRQVNANNLEGIRSLNQNEGGETQAQGINSDTAGMMLVMSALMGAQMATQSSSSQSTSGGGKRHCLFNIHT